MDPYRVRQGGRKVPYRDEGSTCMIPHTVSASLSPPSFPTSFFSRGKVTSVQVSLGRAQSHAPLSMPMLLTPRARRKKPFWGRGVKNTGDKGQGGKLSSMEAHNVLKGSVKAPEGFSGGKLEVATPRFCNRGFFRG